MLKPIRSILFATDLTVNCQQALDFTMVIAIRFKAKIYMLHVIEELPHNIDVRLKDLLGKHQWEDLVNSHKDNIRRTLIGKQSTNSIVREALYKLFKETDIHIENHDFKSSEIIISDGGIAENILTKASENECDLIVLGGHENLFSASSAFGGITKTVLKKSTIPVTIVPPLVG